MGWGGGVGVVTLLLNLKHCFYIDFKTLPFYPIRAYLSIVLRFKVFVSYSLEMCYCETTVVKKFVDEMGYFCIRGTSVPDTIFRKIQVLNLSGQDDGRGHLNF